MRGGKVRRERSNGSELQFVLLVSVTSLLLGFLFWSTDFKLPLIPLIFKPLLQFLRKQLCNYTLLFQVKLFSHNLYVICNHFFIEANVIKM